MATSAPRVLPRGLEITEKAFIGQVIDLARTFGWRDYHPYLSIHSARGWPDLALCRPPRLVLAELKSEKGKVSSAQQEWLDLLRECPGLEVFVWRPSDFDDIVRVLQRPQPVNGTGPLMQEGTGANIHSIRGGKEQECPRQA